MRSKAAALADALTTENDPESLGFSTVRLARIGGKVEKAAGRKLAFIGSGGIQKSPESLQRLANVLGRPVYASAEPEASLRGAACFAMEEAL